MYRVVFVYTANAGGYEGVRTWSIFESKESFQAFYTDDIRANEEIVEEGISEERCIELVKQTPAICRVTAAIENNTNPATGRVNISMLAMELEGAAMAQVLAGSSA